MTEARIFAEETTVPLNGSHEIAGTGVKVKFAEATEESQKPSSFLVNDTYTFETTAPSMTVGDISAAIDKLKTFNEEYEFCHIVGSTGLAVWQMVSTTQVELAKTYHKPMFFLLEAAYPDAAAVRGSRHRRKQARGISPTGRCKWKQTARRSRTRTSKFAQRGGVW